MYLCIYECAFLYTYEQKVVEENETYSNLQTLICVIECCYACFGSQMFMISFQSFRHRYQYRPLVAK